MKIGGAIIAAAVLAGIAGCASAPPQSAGGVPRHADVPSKRAEPTNDAPAATSTGTAAASAAPAVAPQPEAASSSGAPPRPAAAESGTSNDVVAEVAVLPSGNYAIMVESQPSGATVVVDGIPVGRSPRKVVVTGTSMGFFRDPMSIKVRFVATDAQSVSQTVEELLTPRDRIPAALIFTPAGTQRKLR